MGELPIRHPAGPGGPLGWVHIPAAQRAEAVDNFDHTTRRVEGDVVGPPLSAASVPVSPAWLPAAATTISWLSALVVAGGPHGLVLRGKCGGAHPAAVAAKDGATATRGHVPYGSGVVIRGRDQPGAIVAKRH